MVLLVFIIWMLIYLYWLPRIWHLRYRLICWLIFWIFYFLLIFFVEFKVHRQSNVLTIIDIVLHLLTLTSLLVITHLTKIYSKFRKLFQMRNSFNISLWNLKNFWFFKICVCFHYWFSLFYLYVFYFTFRMISTTLLIRAWSRLLTFWFLTFKLGTITTSILKTVLMTIWKILCFVNFWDLF